jgi:Sulfotransferase family
MRWPRCNGIDVAVEGHRLVRPVILLGAPRSGTSLLAKVFEAHPDVALLNEPRLVWRYGNDGRSDQLRPHHATQDVVDHIHQYFGSVLAQQAAARLVEKTPANSLRPHFVDAVFPDACYVHITRNGWAAVPSIRSFWQRRGTGMDARQLRKARRRLTEASRRQWRHYGLELARRVAAGRHTPLYGPRLAGLQQVADELGRLEAAAVQWRTCVDSVTVFGRALGPARYTEVQLETLDSAAIESLLDFCALPRSTEVLERFCALYRPDVGASRQALTADERALIAPYVEPGNAWLGYPVSSFVEVNDRSG